MNVSLRQLKGFISIAATSSFTKTAQRLHQSQAALSSMIRELESQLGCRLFHRSTRTVELTEAGHRFVPTATAIVEMLESAGRELAEIGREEGIVLRIGVTPTIAQSLMPSVVTEFKMRAPNVTVIVSDSPPAELQQMTEAGRLDAAFGAFFSKASGLDKYPVFESRLQLLSSRKLDPELPPSVPWTLLDGSPLITLHESSPIQQLTDAQLAKLGIAPAARIGVNQLETMIAYAEGGLGFAVVPSFARAACDRYDVSVATLTPSIKFFYHRITRVGHRIPRSLQSLTELIAEVVGEHDTRPAP